MADCSRLSISNRTLDIGRLPSCDEKNRRSIDDEGKRRRVGKVKSNRPKLSVEERLYEQERKASFLPSWLCWIANLSELCQGHLCLILKMFDSLGVR